MILTEERRRKAVTPLGGGGKTKWLPHCNRWVPISWHLQSQTTLCLFCQRDGQEVTTKRPTRVSQRKRSLTMKDEPETEHGHRKGLSVVTMTALVSTLLIQVQVELECTIRRHTRQCRKSEVDMLAYDLDAPLLGQQEEVMCRERRVSGSELAAPAAEHKKAMVEAKLQRLRAEKSCKSSPSA